MSAEYPAGYTPMTQEEIYRVWIDAPEDMDGRARAIERAVLARLPKQDTAERVITPELIDRCAQRLAQWDEGAVWPDSWETTQVAKMRRDAEKVLREAGYQDAAERDALVRRIDECVIYGANVEAAFLLCDLRAHLVGGGE